MNNSPLTILRELGKPALAGLLVGLLFVSALASADPSLHRRLHADHQTPSHYCLVTMLDHGQSEVAITCTVAIPAVSDFPATALPCESFFIACDVVLFPERGPPRLS